VKKRLGVDKEGFSVDKSGNRIVGSESQDQLDRRVAANYGDDFAKDERAVRASNIRLQIEDLRSGMGSGGNTQEVTALLAELAKLEAEIAKAKQEAATQRKSPATPGAVPNVAPSPSPAPSPDRSAAPAPAPEASRTQTVYVNLSINNKASGTVDTSPQGSFTLQAFLSQLADAKSRAAG
jgi:hypothetical protein